MDPAENPDDDKLQNTYNPLKVMQQGERVLCEIKRHPVGLWGIYAGAIVVVVAVVAGLVVVPHYIPNMAQSSKAGLAIGGVFVAAIALLYAYVAHVVYTGNRWVVTTDSLTQISQVGLFRKTSSQLSLANLEDVSANQSGLFQSMVGYGTLKVETAGEHSKFTFPFCPKPNEFAKQIIAAHEAYIAHNPEEMRVTNRPLANVAAYNQSYGPAAGYGEPSQQPYQPPQAYEPTQQQAAPEAQNQPMATPPAQPPVYPPDATAGNGPQPPQNPPAENQ